MYDLHMLTTNSFSNMGNKIYKGKHLIFATCFVDHYVVCRCCFVANSENFFFIDHYVHFINKSFISNELCLAKSQKKSTSKQV